MEAVCNAGDKRTVHAVRSLNEVIQIGGATSSEAAPTECPIGVE